MLLLIDRLYPLGGQESWFWTDRNGNISNLKLVPLQIRGVGVKLRKRIYGGDIVREAHYFVSNLWTDWEQRYDTSMLAFNEA